jgi:hypothetical protein
LKITPPTIVNGLWAVSFLLQLFVCGILMFRGHFRTFPFLTAYVALNICQAVLLYFIYRRFGRLSHAAYVAAWWSEAITVLARVFATVEIIHMALISYRGIWGLAWRLLGLISLVMSIAVTLAAEGDATWALLNADRGYHLIFAMATVGCLLLIRYYRISVRRVYKTLLATLCFYSCVKILLDTVLQNILYAQYLEYGAIWQMVSLLSYIVILTLWAEALWHPLPVIEPQRAVLPPSVYQQVAPEINFQLDAINKRLMGLFKIKERQP